MSCEFNIQCLAAETQSAVTDRRRSRHQPRQSTPIEGPLMTRMSPWRMIVEALKAEG
ncbi:uncharacterized protein METZ01_LOCUS300100, partial [marine metagenome]